MGTGVLARLVSTGVLCVLLMVASALPSSAETPPTTTGGSVEAVVGDAFATGAEVQLDRRVEGTKVPADSGDGLRVPTAQLLGSVGIGLPGADTEASLTDDGAAVYEDIATDASLVVAAVDVSATPEVDSAVRTLITIESEASPTNYAFPLDLPAGAVPQPLADGSVAVVDRKNMVIGVFAAPWATDATGATVATRFVVDGERVIQQIDHRGAVYPVVADPFWFVPAILVGVRLIAPVVIKAATRKAAQKAAAKAAAKIAKSQGKKVKSLGATTKVKFTLAKGTSKIAPGRYTTAKGHTSFARFKAKYGNAKKNSDWHHIVEQKHATKGRFNSKAIHNPNNLVQVPRTVHHKCINSVMGRKSAIVPGLSPARGKTMRQTIDGYRTYSQMHEAGVRILRFCGVKV